ncbi:MAG: 50S ribosomal protein L1 [Candidatus Bipolaricaulota bacterium]
MTTTRGKRYLNASEKVDPEATYPLDEAIDLAKETATAGFDESLEAAFNMGVNPSQTMIRGTTVLPNGTGKKVRVVAFARGETQREAEEANADWVGGEELAEKIEDGWLEFDQVVATPEMMSVVGRLGRILGPRGMMPSPKSNTVTEDLGDAISKLKKGQIEFRTDKYGVIHVPFGRATFESEHLRENLIHLLSNIYAERPEDLQARYLQKATISATMGPGVGLEVDELRRLAYDYGI